MVVDVYIWLTEHLTECLLPLNVLSVTFNGVEAQMSRHALFQMIFFPFMKQKMNHTS